MAQGLPDLVSHVRLDTTGVTAGVAKTKTELGALGGATKGLEGEFKSLLTSITGVGGGTSQLSGIFSKFTGSVGTAKSVMSGAAGEGSKLTSILTGVGAGVAGVGLALGALAVEGIGKFTAAAGEVRKLQGTLGSTAEEASKLRNVAIGLGVDVDSMGKALFKLGPILEKERGDLAGIHVEIAKNADGSTNLVGTLDNMRAAYQSLNDPVQKAQFLQEAFKKTGLELRPILSASADVFDRLSKTGPIFKQADLDKAKELSQAQREMRQALDELQITLARGAVPSLANWSNELTKVTKNTFSWRDGVDLVTKAVTGHVADIGKMSDKQKEAAGSAQAARDAQDKLAAALKETQAQAEAAAAAFDKLVTAQESALDADLAMDRALRAAVASSNDMAEANLKLAQAHQTVLEKQTALTEARQSGKATAEELRGMELDLQSAQLAEAEAARGVTDAQNGQRDTLIAAAKAVRDKQAADLEAGGASVSAEQKVRLFIQALRDQAGTLAPGSELRSNLEGYANKLEKGIPREVNTHISLDTADAEQKLANLRARLSELDASIAASGPGGGRGAERNAVQAERNAVQAEIDSSSSGGGSSTPNAQLDQAESGGILGRTRIIPMARGGRTAGFITNGPRFLVGEGNPRYPEAVIATDPQFRARNIDILSWAARRLGMAAGGITSGASGGASVPMPIIDYARLGEAVAAAIAANPSRSYVLTSDVASGLSKARRL